MPMASSGEHRVHIELAPALPSLPSIEADHLGLVADTFLIDTNAIGYSPPDRTIFNSTLLI